MIIIDYVIRVNKRCYSQAFLEEFKYEIKKNKIEILIDNDLGPRFFDNKFVNESDNESDNDYDNDESND